MRAIFRLPFGALPAFGMRAFLENDPLVNRRDESTMFRLFERNHLAATRSSGLERSALPGCMSAGKLWNGKPLLGG